MKEESIKNITKFFFNACNADEEKWFKYVEKMYKKDGLYDLFKNDKKAALKENKRTLIGEKNVFII